MNCDFDTKLQVYIDEKNLFNRYTLKPSIPLESKFKLTPEEYSRTQSKIASIGQFDLKDINNFDNFYDQSLLLDVNHPTMHKSTANFKDVTQQRSYKVNHCDMTKIKNQNKVLDKYFLNKPTDLLVEQNHHVTPNLKFKRTLYNERPVDLKLKGSTLHKTYDVDMENLNCHNTTHRNSVNYMTQLFDKIDNWGTYDLNDTDRVDEPINEVSRFKVTNNSNNKNPTINYISPSMTHEGVTRLMGPKPIGDNKRNEFGQIHKSRSKVNGYLNPFEHYFSYIDPELQHPDHVVLPIPRGGNNARFQNKNYTCKFNETEFINKILNEKVNITGLNS